MVLVESPLVSLTPSVGGCLVVMVVVARGERERVGGDGGWVVDGRDLLFAEFEQLPSLPGRQSLQLLPAFTQAQPWQRPLLLHRQH